MELSDQGLIKPTPAKDDAGTVLRWMVYRTSADRP
jgi:hypothetical protein